MHSGSADSIAADLEAKLRERARAVRTELWRKQLADRQRKSWLRRAERIARGEFEAYTPPDAWSFVPRLRDKLAGKKIAEPIYDEEQAGDWRTFQTWRALVCGDVVELVEVMGYFTWAGREADGEPRASLSRDLHARVSAAVTEIKERYREWDEAGRIEWFPKHFYSAPLRDPRRRQVTAIEYLALALIDFDNARGALL